MSALSRFMSYRPEREECSQPLRNLRVRSTCQDGLVRLLAADFLNLRKYIVRARESSRPRFHHFLRLGHRPLGLGIGNTGRSESSQAPRS